MSKQILEKFSKRFKTLFSNINNAIEDNFILTDIESFKNHFNLLKHIKSDSEGYWEGYYLIVDDLGYKIEYKIKLKNSSKYLSIHSFYKEYKDVIDFQNKSVTIGELFKKNYENIEI